MFSRLFKSAAHGRLDGLAHVLSSSFQRKAAEETRRWDKEWLRYLSNQEKNYAFYFYDMSSDTYALDVSPARIAELTAQEFFDTKLCKNMKGRVWAPGADFIAKDVLEIGCGPGVFGRLSGRFATSYTGIDISQLALSVARLTSPKNCRYFHLYDPAGLQTLAKSVDVSLGRHFFIHHNYEDSLWLLRFLRDLTRDGGLIIADFFSDPSTLDGKRRLGADAELQKKYPSALFSFENEDIERLASEANLRVEAIEHRPEHSNRFTRFRVGS